MFAADAKPSGQVRPGLDTSTGSRSAARKAGAPKPAITSYEPAETFDQMFQRIVDKSTETERLRAAAEKNKLIVEAGGNPELSVGGSQANADVAVARQSKGLATGAGIASNAYKDRVNTDFQNAVNMKGLNSGGNTIVTAASFMERAAADEEKYRLQENIRRDQQNESNKNAQTAAGVADQAYSQRYAASVNADAAKQAAAYNMIGQLSSSSGGYKYWGQ